MDASSVFFRPRRGLLLAGLSLPLLLSSCLPTGQTTIQPYPGGPPEPQEPAQAQHEKPASSRQTLSPEEQTAYARQVSERIAAYEQRLRDWQDMGSRRETLNLTSDEVEQLVSCRNQVADLQDAYKGLQAQLIPSQPSPLTRDQLLATLEEFKAKDIAYLEGDCPKLFNSLSTPADSGKTAAKQEPVSSPPASASETPAAGSGISQGLTQLHNGHELEARSTFVNVLIAARRDGDQRLEANALQLLADLDFGHQDYVAAHRKYADLRRLDSKLAEQCARYMDALEAVGSRREELSAYAALLLGCLTYNPAQDGFTVVQQASEFIRLFPDSPLKTDATDWSHKIEQEAEQWFSGLIKQAGQLPPDQALKRLEQVPLDILPLDKQDIIRQKKEALQAAAAAMPAGQVSAAPLPESSPPGSEPAGKNPSSLASPLPDPVAALQETWDKGVAAMQAQDYDQAIELLSRLRGTEFEAKAEGKIEEAERLAGESVRKKAAEFFQQALNAAEPAAKKKLLLSSKALLEEILRKYPRAGIEDKVKRNLSSVDRELAAAGSGSQH